MRGRVVSLDTLPIPDRRLPHSRVFSSPADISGAVSADDGNVRQQERNQINELFGPQSKPVGENGEYFAVDVQPDLPGVPAASRSCLRCGAPVPAPKTIGRPRRFCSAACRHAQGVEQRRRWEAKPAAQDKRDALTCWHCGDAFEAPAARAGRLPRFCRSECRTIARRAAAAAMRNRRRRAGTRQDELSHGA